LGQLPPPPLDEDELLGGTIELLLGVELDEATDELLLCTDELLLPAELLEPFELLLCADELLLPMELLEPFELLLRTDELLDARVTVNVPLHLAISPLHSP